VTAYADTSWWVASKFLEDKFFHAARSIFDHSPTVEILWTPWQRVEVFNALHQLERVQQYAIGESQKAIRMLEKEVALGYWQHREFSWTNAIRTAVTLSAKHGTKLPVRGMDLFHVAIALTLKAEAFLTFDDEQRALAKASGLKVIALK
jgi:predicted nucleic acid-binding protein